MVPKPGDDIIGLSRSDLDAIRKARDVTQLLDTNFVKISTIQIAIQITLSHSLVTHTRRPTLDPYPADPTRKLAGLPRTRAHPYLPVKILSALMEEYNLTMMTMQEFLENVYIEDFPELRSLYHLVRNSPGAVPILQCIVSMLAECAIAVDETRICAHGATTAHATWCTSAKCSAYVGHARQRQRSRNYEASECINIESGAPFCIRQLGQTTMVDNRDMDYLDYMFLSY
ncbi:hypothetical protein GGX14DRAFT_386039 [Mycena pura]|uniref:Uncharacterized protein n=1 Tax=Mycena pura TaxID=153505 RepID=A0AAD6YRQ9_9AGAR|nr:hypothetical protein GGX14DRAFT_386039 [Mycena pura]